MFGTAVFLILYFLHGLYLSSTLQQLLFQHTYYLFLGWLLIAQTQYQNRDNGCEEIIRQNKDLRSWVKKGNSNLKIKQASSFQKVKFGKKTWKKYLFQKVAIPDLFSVTN